MQARDTLLVPRLGGGCERLDTGWVVGFDIGVKGLLWVPPVDRDYGLGRSISKSQKRSLVRRASKEHAVRLVHGFELVEDKSR